MDIAKPPGGFNIDEPAGVTSAITAHVQQWPRLQTHWADVKSRLQQVGHREGTPVKNGPRGARIYVAEGDETIGLPTIKVAYSVLGDTLRIRMVLIG
jgi:hypothetical protein